MMNKKQQIEKNIKQIELQLKKLTLTSNGSDICEDLQNSLILKKAILKKDLEILNRNPLVETIKNFILSRKLFIVTLLKVYVLFLWESK